MTKLKFRTESELYLYLHKLHCRYTKDSIKCFTDKNTNLNYYLLCDGSIGLRTEDKIFPDIVKEYKPPFPEKILAHFLIDKYAKGHFTDFVHSSFTGKKYNDTLQYVCDNSKIYTQRIFKPLIESTERVYLSIPFIFHSHHFNGFILIPEFTEHPLEQNRISVAILPVYLPENER